VATVGDDIDPYFSRFKSLGLEQARIEAHPGPVHAQGLSPPTLDNKTRSHELRIRGR